MLVTGNSPRRCFQQCVHISIEEYIFISIRKTFDSGNFSTLPLQAVLGLARLLDKRDGLAHLCFSELATSINNTRISTTLESKREERFMFTEKVQGNCCYFIWCSERA